MEKRNFLHSYVSIAIDKILILYYICKKIKYIIYLYQKEKLLNESNQLIKQLFNILLLKQYFLLFNVVEMVYQFI